MMHDFTPDESRRWDAWRQTNAVSAQRTDRIVRGIAIVLFAMMLIGLGIALSQ